MKYLAIVAAVLAACAPTPAPINRPAPVAFTGSAADQAIATAESALIQRLREPESARIHHVVALHSSNLRGEPVDVVCGDYQGRNGFGGMSGGAGFVYMIADGTLYMGEDDLGAAVFTHLCEGE
jgi:hypothetical protein